MADLDIKDIEKRMHGAIENLKKEFAGLRTGRAHASLLDPVMVDAYGSQMPLNQVGSVNVPEPRMMSVQVWDKTMVGPVEKAIRDAGLGLNPIADGQSVRVPIPDLSEERRKELVKVSGQYAEKAKVAVRNIRRDGMDALKKAEKDGDIPKDEMHDKSGNVQELTDSSVKSIDELASSKEAEIMQV